MRRLAAPVLLAAGLALAGFGPVNRSSETVHQPIVTRTDFTLDLRTDGYGHLAPGEAARLGAWFDALRLDYGDTISVDGDGGRNDVANVASDYGLLLAAAPPVTAGAVPPGALRVIVSRATAVVTGCPDWRRPSVFEFEASTMSNYGCATETNLAAMVANPEDLVRGQAGALGGSDAQTVAKAIKVYRDQAATGSQALKTESTGGK